MRVVRFVSSFVGGVVVSWLALIELGLIVLAVSGPPYDRTASIGLSVGVGAVAALATAGLLAAIWRRRVSPTAASIGLVTGPVALVSIACAGVGSALHGLRLPLL